MCVGRAACRSKTCLSEDKFTLANCSLYADKACTRCTQCAKWEYVTANCSEYSDRACGLCSNCTAQQYASRNCSLYFDKQCAACSTACNGCTGPTDTQCKSCTSGYVSVMGATYGGPPAERKCVPFLNCTYTEWGNWTDCSAPCGGGRRHRWRDLDTIWPCSNPQRVNETATCNTDQCRALVCLLRCAATCFGRLSMYCRVCRSISNA